ncbi:transcriptional activator RfaH [Bradyrhizobium sp. AUGA SZCCT0158]|uniref:transcription termination/antitermination protein NusG n=1 Tax=Bradyrhizobium sp. AUGA SZCCT0158 TaxID=2807661 RepID=UPI001BAAA052|nr:transcriptional activator RfaH [Bradyrhizobium sp. AUGA SZCCT0158]MBR1199519.1 transcriptional activator RfaH [Bradyrhizobium sp. AUGA SZCCT0158]
MNEVNDSHWYVVQTRVNSETKAARNLIRQGFETYLPRYLKNRSHAGKIEKVAAPLFPRYLFVQINIATQRWRAVQSTFGVSHLVTNGPSPVPVAEQVLCMLRSREDQRGFVKLDRRPQFSVGEKVRVLAGAFADNLGLFDGLGDRDRIAILLDLLGRKVRVSIEADMVAAA